MTLAALSTASGGILDDVIAGIVAISIITALFFYGRYEHEASSVAQAAAKQNAATITQLQKETVAANAAAAKEASMRQSLQDQLALLRKGNANAPNGNKPVSPTVGDTLNSLLNGNTGN